MIAEFAQRKLAAASRKAAVVAVVGASALTGAGLLTAAGWTVLAHHYSSVIASATVGDILLTPLVGMGLAKVFRRVKEPEPTAPPAVTFTQVMLAFTLATKLGETLIRLRTRENPIPEREPPNS
jgi:hypothetical protein